MRLFGEEYRLRNSVKEAVDNLPGGVCFFNSNGILILCNRQMYRLAFLLMGHDLQTLGELREALEFAGETDREGRAYHLSDDSWWNFFVNEVADDAGRRFTEVTAFDITDLHEKEELLQEANEARSQTVETLKQIQDNIVSIAREEEILAMKMQLHNEFGYNLQTICHFYWQGCPPEMKENFVRGQEEAIKKLQGELDRSDEIDSFTELARLAETLDMRISVEGELPGQTKLRDILADAMRECLTNTIRHAEGSEVFLELDYEQDEMKAYITNNGKLPAGEIRESGGLASLRKRIEGFGGTMIVRSRPEFRLEIALPAREDR